MNKFFCWEYVKYMRMCVIERQKRRRKRDMCDRVRNSIVSEKREKRKEKEK